jgi:predicted amidophosphoribosyltransferase
VRFDEISRVLVHALKYGDRLDLAPMMGRWISRAGREVLAEADALVPVPLHWRRLWTRRFNQSAMLAAAVSAASGVPMVTDALKRVKATVQQVGLSRSERVANVQGAFRVPEPGKAAVAAAGSSSSTTCSRPAPRSGLRPGAVARGGRQRRRARFRQGCRSVRMSI